MKQIDTHAHILKQYYETELKELIKEINNKMLYVINIGIDYKTSNEVIELSKNEKKILPIVGIHPLSCNDKNSLLEINKLENLISKESKIIGIGEIGLDYYYDHDKDYQKKAFIKQINIAIKYKLPIIIHTRESIDDTLNIIENYPNQKFLLHSWTGDILQTKRALEFKNVIFGVNGIVTFKNAKKLNETLKILPIDRIVIETDCPYLSPDPLRGKKNNPLNVNYISKYIAKIKKINENDLIKITNNTSNLFFNLNYEI